MDKLSNSTSEPVASDHRRRPDRSWHPAHQHARFELHRRLLRHQCQLRGRGYHIHALSFRVWISDFRKVDVLILGRALGYDSLGTLRCCPGASSRAVLLLWEQHSCEEQVETHLNATHNGKSFGSSAVELVGSLHGKSDKSFGER